MCTKAFPSYMILSKSSICASFLYTEQMTHDAVLSGCAVTPVPFRSKDVFLDGESPCAPLPVA